MRIVNVILAAGSGTRMNSSLPKVMHPVMGRPMVEWSVRCAENLSDEKPIVVVGHGREQVEALLSDRVHYAVQEELLGTGHAVQQAVGYLKGQADAVLVTYADMPLLRSETLSDLAAHFAAQRDRTDAAVIAMLTVEREDPQGFGRIVRNSTGGIQAIVEEVDCTPEQKEIRELNPGIYCFAVDWLLENLSKIPLSAKGEYYLTDLIGIAVAQNRKVVTVAAPESEVYGINTRVHLAEASQVLRQRVIERLQLAGVTIVDPPSTYIEDGVTIGMDSTVLPGCVLQGESSVGSETVVGPYSQIVDSIIGNQCRVTYSVLEQARMEDGAQIGPFGHLRPGAHLGRDVHMGNFGEVKNSYLGPGVKMGHFSYIGDSQIGENVNIGAGTITCNFDGEKKQPTTIGKNAFIGSDTLLVAPVSVGEGAKTGAGSVVTHDVPAGTIVYGVPARPAPSKNQYKNSDDVRHEQTDTDRVQ